MGARVVLQDVLNGSKIPTSCTGNVARTWSVSVTDTRIHDRVPYAEQTARVLRDHQLVPNGRSCLPEQLAGILRGSMSYRHGSSVPLRDLSPVGTYWDLEPTQTGHAAG